MKTRIALARVVVVIGTALLIGATSSAATQCPEYVGAFSWDVGAEALDVAAFGPYLFALSPTGLFVAMPREPLPWQTFGEIEFSGVPVGYSVRGFLLRWPYAYVDFRFSHQMDRRKILVVDVSHPWSPAEVGWMDFPEGFESFEAYRDHLYVWQESWLRIFNVSDPSSPVEVGAMECPAFQVIDGFGFSGGNRIDVDGSWSTRISLFDLSNPALPVEMGSCDVTDFLFDEVIDVSRGRAYVYGFGLVENGVEEEVLVLDVSEPSSLALIDSGALPLDTDVGYFWPVAIRGEIAFATGDYWQHTYGFFYVLDISDISSPTAIGVVETSRGLGDKASVADGFVYIASPSQGVDVFDVRGCPTFPSHLHSGTLGERGDFTAGE